MTLVDPQIDMPVVIEPRRGMRHALFHNPLAMVAIVILLIVAIVAVVSPWITPHNPNVGHLDLTNARPGGAYLLGGDGSGRDILSRLIVSTRVSVLSALIGTGVALAIGVSLGLVAGYYGRAFDAIGTWTANILMAVPSIIALIAVYAAVGASTQVAMLVFGFLISPSLFRLVRNLVIGVKSELYVDAARVAGLSDRRIVARHILYAVRAPIIIQAAFIAGATIAIQAGLDFLGLGNANEPSWGQMLEEAFANLYLSPTQLIWPGVTLALTVSALVFLGNGIRDALEGPRVRPKRPRKKKRTQPTEQTAPALTGGSAAIAGDSILLVRDLTVAYPSSRGKDHIEVVTNVNIDVGVGEVVGLVGESGSGKTQTAFSILGLLPEEAIVVSGSVLIDGAVYRDLSRNSMRPVRGRVVAYIPQEPMSNLDPSFKVGKQLVYGIRAVTHASFKEAKRQAIALLGRVGLANPQAVFEAYPHELSGGMAQRVLIAGAVACHPKLLIADEPTTALDVTVQAEILELLRDLQREHEMGVLLVTHNFGVVADLCDRVAVMQDGSIVEEGRTAEIFAQPEHPYTKLLLEAILPEDVVRPELVPSGEAFS